MNARMLAMTCALVLTGGCGQAPVAPAPVYLLPGAIAVGLSSLEVQVRLAGYLDQGGIVLQLSDSELHGARQHRWAEPLSQQLQRALEASLNGGGLPERGQLMVQLSQFQGVRSSNGDLAVIRGAWQFTGQSQEITQGRISWQAPLPGDGYGPLVETLDQGWQQVANSIASALR